MRPYVSFIARAALGLTLIAFGAPGCKLLELGEGDGNDQPAPPTQQEDRDTSARTEGADAPPKGAPTTTAPAVTTTPSAAPTPADALPPLDRGPRPVDQIKASKDADKAGDIIDEAKDYAAAEIQYRRAVELDPGNVFARYNVARTLVLQDKVREGVAALATLSTKDCALCRERILAASLHDDFAKAKQTPEFIELAKDLHKSLPAVDAAAQSVVKWFLSTEGDEIPEHEYVDPRSTIVIEDHTKGAKKRFVQLHGSAEFRRHVKEHYPKGIYPGGTRTCAKGCCDIKGNPIGGVHLRRMCFQTSGTSAVHLYKIMIEGNPANSFPG